MLLPFIQLARKYNMKIKGVIQAGAHYLEEYELYQQLGIENIVAIEPCDAAFQVLLGNFKDNHNIILFNHAIGEFYGKRIMYVETANGGQSNSLLEPDKHLEQFPTIKFPNKEEVDMEMLDSLPFDRSKYNMIVMDLQGYEGYAMQGAKETLKTIDYIYSEVNRDSIYKGNTRIEELDIILEDFVRVETNWAGGNWGDALYIRTKLYYEVLHRL